MNEAHKLHHLLDHWIEHNKSHREEFERWSGRARDFGLAQVAAAIGAAAGRLDEATACLEMARADLHKDLEKKG